MKFLNYSNHPSNGWLEGQIAAAKEYGEIVDLDFPNINPEFTATMISSLADEAVNRITSYGKDIIVHIMGEMTFTYAVVSRLKALGIKCVASTTKRDPEKTIITPDGKKISEFKFVQFREY
jgi:hypothetical protein